MNEEELSLKHLQGLIEKLQQTQRQMVVEAKHLEREYKEAGKEVPTVVKNILMCHGR